MLAKQIGSEAKVTCMCQNLYQAKFSELASQNVRQTYFTGTAVIIEWIELAGSLKTI